MKASHQFVKEFPEITTQFPCKRQLWQLEDAGTKHLFIQEGEQRHNIRQEGMQILPL